MIAQRFQSVVWVVGVATAATGLYLVSLQVAAERGRVERVSREIDAARRELHQLQTELGARASLRQLEKWNGEALALSAPNAEQFVRNATQLAALAGPLTRPELQGVPEVRLAGLTDAQAQGGGVSAPEFAPASAQDSGSTRPVGTSPAAAKARDGVRALAMPIAPVHVARVPFRQDVARPQIQRVTLSAMETATVETPRRPATAAVAPRLRTLDAQVAHKPVASAGLAAPAQRVARIQGVTRAQGMKGAGQGVQARRDSAPVSAGTRLTPPPKPNAAPLAGAAQPLRKPAKPVKQAIAPLRPQASAQAQAQASAQPLARGAGGGVSPSPRRAGVSPPSPASRTTAGRRPAPDPSTADRLKQTVNGLATHAERERRTRP